jgi:hypothetical protein
MGFLQAYQAMLQDEDNRLKEERAQRDEDEKRKVLGNRSALADQINDQIKKLVYEAIEPDEGAIKTQSAAAGQEAARARIGQQYEAGQTLTPQQVNTIADAANEKTPSLGNLPALRARENLINIGKPGKNLPRLSSIKDYGYDLPDMPTQTPEGDIAAQEAQKVKEKELRSVKPDYGKLGIKVASELSGPMLKAQVKKDEVPVLGVLGEQAERQSKEFIKGDKNQDTLAEAQRWKEQFLTDPTARHMVWLYATGKMSEQEAMAKVPGFNKQSGPARLALTYAAIEVNPPQYDTEGNLVSGFDPMKFALARKEESAFVNESGKLRPTIIKKKAEQAGEIRHASELAALEEDVLNPKIEKTARQQAAATLLKQRMAGQRAISTFDDALNEFGDYENIPNWMYRDLASDYAKMLVATGQIAEGSVDKVMQMSAKGLVVELWNFVTGDTETTAPQKVLALMHNRIKALTTDVEKQYYNQIKGKNIPINSDESTNPLKPVEPVKPVKPGALTPGKSKISDADIISKYRKKP